MTSSKEFAPALTKDEATSRIYSALGASPRGTRGEKGALDALLTALQLDLEVAKTTSSTAQTLASKLRVPWSANYSDRHKVSLSGLNAILRAVEGSDGAEWTFARPSNIDADLAVKFDATFIPAISKIEAVNRLSTLAGKGAEELGPGGKERKRVLINTAMRFAPDLDTSLTKSNLAAAIAKRLGAPWDRMCASTGETISLRGLNVLIAGAEAQVDPSSSRLNKADPALEGRALINALHRGITERTRASRGVWDGKRSVEWMRAQGLRTEMNQSEWQGFYFEALGRSILASSFSRPSSAATTKYGQTFFDYSHEFVWDLKVHTEAWVDGAGNLIEHGSPDTILNDQTAITECAADRGIGFLVLSGDARVDEGDLFKGWHRGFKRENGVRSRGSNSGKSRRLKAAFTPTRLDAFFFPDAQALDDALSQKVLSGFKQGRQAPGEGQTIGSPRARKLKARIDRLRGSGFHVAEATWPKGQGD